MPCVVAGRLNPLEEGNVDYGIPKCQHLPQLPFQQLWKNMIWRSVNDQTTGNFFLRHSDVREILSQILTCFIRTKWCFMAATFF